MLTATTFTYDGVYSGQYGMIIAEINTENIQETTPFAPVIRTTKTPKAKRFSFAGIEYEEMPRFQISFMCEEPIPDLIRREILTWLVARNGFKKLQIHQPEYDDYLYNCIFEETRIIFISGACHGFILTATFDSPYCYGRPRKKIIKSDGTEEVEVILINESDMPDEYVYPFVKFKANGFIDGKSISIVNSSDIADPHRAFEFTDDITPELEEIEVDNELKIITSNIPGDHLGKFNKNWLRLIRGPNKLKIRIDGECTVECPQYVKIGF